MVEYTDPFEGLKANCYTCDSENTIIERDGDTPRFVVACHDCGARWHDRLYECDNCGRIIRDEHQDACLHCAKRLCVFCIDEEGCPCG